MKRYASIGIRTLSVIGSCVNISSKYLTNAILSNELSCLKIEYLKNTSIIFTQSTAQECYYINCT